MQISTRAKSYRPNWAFRISFCCLQTRNSISYAVVFNQIQQSDAIFQYFMVIILCMYEYSYLAEVPDHVASFGVGYCHYIE